MKTNWLMMLLATVALSFVACTEPEEKPTPGPDPTPEGLTFDVKVGEVTSSSVAYTVTPSDLEAEYLCVLYDAETVEEFTRDEFLVQTLFQELEAEARTVGKTLQEYMPEVVDKGAITDGKFSNLFPESKYYIIVFGVDAAKGYEANTAVSKTEVTTEAFAGLDTTFEVTTTVDGNTAQYQITPSNDDDIWYFYTLPKSTYDAYTDPAGQYQMSEQRFLLFCLEREIEAYRGAGYSDNQILNAIFHKGALTLQAEGLNAQTEYINMIAGFIVTEEGNVTIATDVTTSTYTTGDAKASELTFEISVTDVEMIRAAIKITPSDLKETFHWMCGVWDGEQTAEDVMNGIVAMYGGWMNSGAMLYTGVQDYTGGPGSPYKYKLDSPDTDYYVVAFGYAGGVTTEPEMVTFRTLPAPDPATTTFTMSASDITPYSFKLSVVPSHATTYYSFNVCAPEEYNEEAIIAAENEAFDSIFEQSKVLNPDLTPVQVLSNYHYRDAAVADATGLVPESSFMGYVIVYNPEDGYVLKIHKFENLATTKSVGSITPGVELVGYYSGDEENGTVFGQPTATKGKAITVVKYTNLDGARSLFATMLGDDMTNTANYSDSYIWGAAAQYWKSVKTAEPYSFYIADWDYVQTALAYAVDQNGVPGGIGRLYTMPTAENKGDIAELKALVDELNAASKSFVLPESLVIGEAKGITISNVTLANEVVEAVEPVAEVKAEAAVLNRVFVGGEYVRPFYM
ncbi:MAG: hypothetical protein E7126_06955 [Rikenellaceae bacterium]|nr:hypothetical protein [Rikenellaceae bacterium]